MAPTRKLVIFCCFRTGKLFFYGACYLRRTGIASNKHMPGVIIAESLYGNVAALLFIFTAPHIGIKFGTGYAVLRYLVTIVFFGQVIVLTSVAALAADFYPLPGQAVIFFKRKVTVPKAKTFYIYGAVRQYAHNKVCAVS